MAWFLSCLILLVSYLIGSLSGAYLVAKAHGIDLREHGSGNLGATNAGRVLGGKWFAVVFLGDVLKGALPPLFVALIWQTEWSTPVHTNDLAVLSALAVVLGHSFTVFHQFRGGKAVASSLGAIFALVPLVACSCLGLWIISWFFMQLIFKLSKSSAVGPSSVIAAAAAIPAHVIIMIVYYDDTVLKILSPEYRGKTLLLALLSVLIIVRHKKNIREFLTNIRTPKAVSE